MYEMNHILNCGYEIKWSYDPGSYEHNISNCVEKPEQFRTSMGFVRIIASLDCILLLTKFINFTDSVDMRKVKSELMQ